MMLYTGLVPLLFAFITLVHCWTTPFGQVRLHRSKTGDSEQIFDTGFDDFVVDILETLHVPGLSLAIIEGDEISSKVRTRRPRYHITLLD